MIKDIKASCVSKNSRHLSSFETQMCVFSPRCGNICCPASALAPIPSSKLLG